jgi:hypothetical protein
MNCIEKEIIKGVQTHRQPADLSNLPRKISGVYTDGQKYLISLKSQEDTQVD